ncbi:hypothetical protein [Butyrivibrio sp. JL13D10]|uniref:hypothetical protein n=1 Tax=Butyrivibrio sp. JL13D10 TaxID=3236815 RepID=UPI0038B623AC
MENEELLKKIALNSEKSYKLQRIRTLLVVVIAAVVVFAIFMVVPKVISTLDKVEQAAVAADETLGKAEATIENIDKMAEALKSSGDNINAMLNENGKTLTDSLEKMSQIDFDGLNQGIKDLQDAVGPLAKFMNTFR